MPTEDLRRCDRKVSIAGWLQRRFAHDHDTMETRLRTARDAGTPMTSKEREKLDESRAQFAAGDFTVD